MLKHLLTGLMVVTLAGGFQSVLRAEEVKVDPDLMGDIHGQWDSLYDKERFETTDLDRDGYLTKEELKTEQQAEGNDFEYYRDEKRLKHADSDGDGRVSFDEAKVEKQWEEAHRDKLSKGAYQDLRNRYPGLDVNAGDMNYLKTHPDVAKELFKNREWLRNHPKVAEDLAGNREWLAQHPEVATRIYHNRQWLSEHPIVAEKLYNNNEFLRNRPELAKQAVRRREWLKAHQTEIQAIRTRAQAAGVTRPVVRDRLEDVVDRREDRRDRREDVRDRKEDRKDRREDVRDRREDGRDMRQNLRPTKPKSQVGAPGQTARSRPAAVGKGKNAARPAAGRGR